MYYCSIIVPVLHVNQKFLYLRIHTLPKTLFNQSNTGDTLSLCLILKQRHYIEKSFYFNTILTEYRKYFIFIKEMNKRFFKKKSDFLASFMFGVSSNLC